MLGLATLRRWWYGVLLAMCLCSASPAAYANEAQLQLQAVFLGRFASYVQWLEGSQREVFEMAVVGPNPFGQQLQALYADKLIHGRPVRITQADSVAALGPQPPDLLFIALPTVAERQAAIAYAHRAHILTVSDAKGFAEQGGIIQMTRVAQNVQIKINYDAALASGLRIAAPLLSIATVLRKDSP